MLWLIYSVCYQTKIRMSYYYFPTGRTVWYLIFASLLTELEKAGKIESFVTKEDA